MAGSTNRTTLIAAILPARCVSTHTLFCLRTPLSLRAQHYLCGLFNSFVVNYFVRLRVTTHVTTATVEQLPPDYVEQILLRMRRAGLVRSTRGARGGYELARSPETVSIRAVIEASEATTFDLHCISHPVEEERCSASHTCSIRPVWQLLQQRIDDVLDSVHLADLLHEEGEVRSRVGLGADPTGRVLPVISA